MAPNLAIIPKSHMHKKLKHFATNSSARKVLGCSLKPISNISKERDTHSILGFRNSHEGWYGDEEQLDARTDDLNRHAWDDCGQDTAGG